MLCFALSKMLIFLTMEKFARSKEWVNWCMVHACPKDCLPETMLWSSSEERG